jgi:hypothetical protein
MLMPQTPRSTYPEYGRLVPEAGPVHPVYRPPEVPLIYADGTVSVGLGANVARIVFFKVALVEPSTPPREIRQISAELVLPANALIEMSVNLLISLKNNPQVQEQLKGPADAVLALLEKISVAP